MAMLEITRRLDEVIGQPFMTAGRKNDIAGFLRQARDEPGFAPPFALEGGRG
jgi:hypothetical protein